MNVKTAEPIRPNIVLWTLRDHREGMIEFSKICLLQNLIFENFENLRIFFCENPRIIFVLFYNAHKENMFTINLENGRENLNTKNYSFKEKKEERKKRGRG